jgi:hypothetical protein
MQTILAQRDLKSLAQRDLKSRSLGIIGGADRR